MTASSEPGVTYVVASLPRSGSTLLCHGLRQTGLAGNPGEHFNARFQEGYLREWGLDAMPPLREYVERATVATRTSNGVFGTKIHWRHVTLMSAKLREDGYGPAFDDMEVLPHCFPRARYIRVVREDKIRQAISLYRALKSDVWEHYDPDARPPRDLSRLADVDLDQVESNYHLLIAAERSWDTFFERHGIEPLTVTYEAFPPAYVETIRSVLEFLGIPGCDGLAIPPPKLVRQADALTDAVAAEIAERVGQTPKAGSRRSCRVPATRTSNPDDLAIVACYFNPCNYRSPRRNLQIFLRRLSERALPVFVAELVFPNQTPVLPESDGTIRATHFTGSDVMFHKERLLNLMVARLPARYTKVAWLDADVIFPDPRWYERASTLLDAYDLAQLFDRAHGLDNAGKAIGRDESLASYVERGAPDPFDFRKVRKRTGLAWAAKRSLLATHGLFDVHILGSADKYMALAAYGAADEAAVWERKRLSPGLERAFNEWAQPFHADVRGRVGCLPTTVLQLGHGRLDDRNYAQRSAIIREYDFDPAADIARDEFGVWRWSSEKPLLHEEVVRHFQSRLEDG